MKRLGVELSGERLGLFDLDLDGACLEGLSDGNVIKIQRCAHDGSLLFCQIFRMSSSLSVTVRSEQPNCWRISSLL